MQNPFTQSIIRGTASIEEMNKQLATVSRLSKNLFAEKVYPYFDMLTKEVYNASGMMSSLANELECSFLRTKYIEILHAVCYDGL